jgi:hypothetical protein
MGPSDNVIQLDFWHITVGDLEKITSQDDSIFAKIGSYTAVLPAEMENVLRPLVGQRIAILRTDSSTKPYLVRTITVKQNEISREDARTAARCWHKGVV